MENTFTIHQNFLSDVWECFGAFSNAIQPVATVATVVTSIILVTISWIVFRRTQGSCFTAYFDHTSLIAEKFYLNNKDQNRDQYFATPCEAVIIQNKKKKSFVISKIFIMFSKEHKILLKSYERRPLNIEPYECKIEAIQPISCFGKNGEKYLIKHIDQSIKPKIILEDLSGKIIKIKKTYKPDTSEKESSFQFLHGKGYDSKYASSTLTFVTQYFQKSFREEKTNYLLNDKINYFIPVRYYGSSNVVYSADIGAVIDIFFKERQCVLVFSKNKNLIMVGDDFYFDFKFQRTPVVEEAIRYYSVFEKIYINLKKESSEKDKELATKIHVENVTFQKEIAPLIKDMYLFESSPTGISLNMEIYDISSPDIFDDVNFIEITRTNLPYRVSRLLRTLRVRLSR